MFERSVGGHPNSVFMSLMMAHRETNQSMEINAGTGMLTVLAI